MESGVPIEPGNPRMSVSPSPRPPMPAGLLFGVFLGTFMALLDVSIVSVALPSMQHGLHVRVAALQWVVDAYTLCLSALVLTGGSLGDRFGRKRGARSARHRPGPAARQRGGAGGGAAGAVGGRVRNHERHQADRHDAGHRRARGDPDDARRRAPRRFPRRRGARTRPGPPRGAAGRHAAYVPAGPAAGVGAAATFAHLDGPAFSSGFRAAMALASLAMAAAACGLGPSRRAAASPPGPHHGSAVAPAGRKAWRSGQ